MKSEPVITVTALSAFVAAVLAVLAAFGLPLTTEQRTAIIGLVAVVAPVVAGFIARRYVTPVSRTVAPPTEQPLDGPPK